MNATIDLDDAEALLAADLDGSLQAASMAGSQVRAVGTAIAEGALEPLRSEDRSRAVVWVSGRGTAATAGAILAGALSDTVSLPFVTATRAPVWVGPLDVMVIAGDDAGDPALSAAVTLGTRRGARVVIAAPDEGPLADSGAGEPFRWRLGYVYRTPSASLTTLPSAPPCLASWTSPWHPM
ncbi:TobH protein [Mycobacteroides abscessus]|nr:TobH protein [Mycobacteroides abscessus]